MQQSKRHYTVDEYFYVETTSDINHRFVLGSVHLGNSGSGIAGRDVRRQFSRREPLSDERDPLALMSVTGVCVSPTWV